MKPTHHSITCPNYKHPLLFGVGKHDMHYVQWGDAQAERVAVCVHGLTRNARDFDYLAHVLVERGYRVLAVDIVGRGQSPHLKKPRYYTYPLYVADMLHFMKKLGLQQVDWIGTSMGGLIGMMLACREPERVARLVINDIGQFIPAAALVRIAKYISGPLAFDTRAEAEKALMEMMASFGINDPEHRTHLVKHGVSKQQDGTFGMAYDQHITDAFWNKRGKLRRIDDMELGDVWDPITQPCLVLRGAESDLLTADTLARMEQKPKVTSVTFDGVGHAPMLMEAQQIEPVVEWLMPSSC